MVGGRLPPLRARADFQYSLCRVVLMVIQSRCAKIQQAVLSVLALSSRFDGLGDRLPPLGGAGAFSTRSVESF